MLLCEGALAVRRALAPCRTCVYERVRARQVRVVRRAEEGCEGKDAQEEAGQVQVCVRAQLCPGVEDMRLHTVLRRGPPHHLAAAGGEGPVAPAMYLVAPAPPLLPTDQLLGQVSAAGARCCALGAT